jgi:hypothetical protein
MIIPSFSQGLIAISLLKSMNPSSEGSWPTAPHTSFPDQLTPYLHFSFKTKRRCLTDLKTRFIGTYGILLGGSFIISLGMDANRMSHHHPVYVLISYLQFCLILPPLIVILTFAFVRLIGFFIEHHQRQKESVGSEIAAAELAEERRRESEIYLKEQERKRLEAERLRLEREKIEAERAKMRLEEKLRRTTDEANDAALEDF